LRRNGLAPTSLPDGRGSAGPRPLFLHPAPAHGNPAERRVLLQPAAAGKDSALPLSRRSLGLAAASFPLAGQTAPAHDAALSFASVSVPITVERFEAAGGSTRPAVILLHGADGMTFPERYRSGARRIAASGFHVFLVHYLNRTGERRASFSSLFRNFPAWSATVSDAIAWVGRQPGVSSARIGLVGVSLGGSLALTAAAQDSRVAVLVDYFGFVPEPFAATVRRLPPTLILHGAKDPIVPVANAYAVEALAKRTGTPYDLKVYADQGHGFYGAAERDADNRVAAFLDRHLG
jgi:carboxymethylenebutenolidase